MTQTAIFWPMIAHVALIVILYALLGQRRAAAVKAGKAKISQFRENLNEPEDSLFVRNCLSNQFELPVLFHIVCLALHVTGGDGAWAVALAWLFVLSRYAHAAIHVTSNRIRHRQPAFIAGFAVLIVLWAMLGFRILTGN
ncbi:MAG: MAPEG family protein [Aquamicrobium sp.]|uniref:MAPEG family protein n=1 Tax=Aquamicrobium sp. TaxID=1872579 RepID=UPI00349E7C9B|nr:MAPEG family protein [Aquamicrobium sp.]